jgi:uncharacterized protein YrrD
MEFKQDADVYTAEGEEVGEVERVVLDPRTKKVTHIVVEKGILFTEDKVVPVSLVASATEERVELRQNAGDLEALPDFQERHFVNLSDKDLVRAEVPPNYPPPMYWYPPLYGAPYAAPMGYPTYPHEPYVVEVEQNIPEGEIALQEGAEVIGVEGDHVGDVDEVLTSPEANRVTHFVIKEGLLFKDKKLVPVEWVNRIDQDRIYLVVGSQTLENLPEYSE